MMGRGIFSAAWSGGHGSGPYSGRLEVSVARRCRSGVHFSLMVALVLLAVVLLLPMGSASADSGGATLSMRAPWMKVVDLMSPTLFQTGTVWSEMSGFDETAVTNQITSFVEIPAVIPLVLAPLAVSLVVIGARGLKRIMGRR